MIDSPAHTDLLAISDYSSAEFVDRIAGLFRHCEKRAVRAVELAEQTEARVAGMRRHTFDDLSVIGEALLRVQEAMPGEFGDWFALHEDRLGFAIAHADRCKAAAKLVREYGPDRAYELSIEKASARPPAILSLSLRLTRPIADLDDSERLELMERLKPVVETYHELERLESSHNLLQIKAA